MLIDAHVHVFPEIKGYGPKGQTRSAGYGRIDFGDGKPEYVFPCINEKTNSTIESVYHNMARYGVDKSVLIINPCYGDWTDYVLEACRKYPQKFTKVAFFDPWKPDVKSYYNEKLKGPLWKNIKIEFSESGGLCGVYPGADLDAPEFRWMWEAMEEDGKTVVFDLGRPGDKSYQTRQIGSIARRHKGLKIVLCHIGQPSHRVEKNPELWSEWLAQIRLGELDNIWFDISAMPYHVQDDEEYPFPSTKRYFDLALSITGPGKIMWGTDLPWLLGTATYGQLVAHGRHLVEDLPEAEQAMILAENAIKVYW